MQTSSSVFAPGLASGSSLLWLCLQSPLSSPTAEEKWPLLWITENGGRRKQKYRSFHFNVGSVVLCSPLKRTQEDVKVWI